MGNEITKDHITALLGYAGHLRTANASPLNLPQQTLLAQLSTLPESARAAALASPAVGRAVLVLMSAPGADTFIGAEDAMAWRTYLAAQPVWSPQSITARSAPPSKDTGQPPRPKVLHPDQREAIDTTVKRIEKKKRHHLLVLPTGAGKTFTAAQLVRELIASGGITGQTLVLTHRIEILEQLRDAFAEVVGTDQVSVVSASHGVFDLSGKVVIGAVRTVNPHLAEFDPMRFDCIISDEAHHVAPDTFWGAILHHFGVVDAEGKAIKESRVLHVGLTATPVRSDPNPLAIPFTPGGIAFNYSIERAIADGRIMRPLGILIPTHRLDLTEPRRHGQSFHYDSDYAPEFLAQVVDNEGYHRAVVQAYLDHARGRRALVFAASVDHAAELTRRFRAAGVRADFVHGDQDPTTRREILARHRNGELDVVTNFGVLTEGYDDPGIQAILMARPTRSPGLYFQMLGRGFRINPSDPTADFFLTIDFTGGMETQGAALNLARAFGLNYTHYDQPAIDPFALKTRLRAALAEIGDETSDAETRRRLAALSSESARDRDDEIYALAETFRTLFDPLPRLLHQVLLNRYDGDQLAMAFALQMSGPRLRSYMGGVFPDQERWVRRDFVHAHHALGIPPEQVARLWQQSTRFTTFSDAIRCFSHPGDISLPTRPQELPEFARAIAKRYAETAGEHLAIARLAGLIEWGRRQDYNVRPVDRVIAGADPQYNPEWAARVVADMLRIRGEEKPATPTDFMRCLRREGNALAEYVPPGVETLAELREALRVRFHPVEAFGPILREYERERTIYVELPGRVPELAAFNRAVASLPQVSGPLFGARRLLADALEAQGFPLHADHQLRGRDDRLTKTREWLGRVLITYGEEAGLQVLELRARLEAMGLSRAPARLEVIDQGVEGAARRLRQAIVWQDPEAIPLSEGLVEIQSRIDLDLANSTIPLGRAVFSARLRFALGIHGAFREAVEGALEAEPFPPRPVEGDEYLLSTVGITPPVREAWERKMGEIGAPLPLDPGVVRTALYALFSRAVQAVATRHQFDGSREMLSNEVGAALRLSPEGVGQWIEHYRTTGLSRETPSHNRYRNVIALDASLLAVRNQAPEVARAETETWVEVSTPSFPSYTPNDVDRKFWEIVMQAEGRTRQWHARYPVGELADLDRFLVAHRVEIGVLPSIVTYFEGRARSTSPSDTKRAGHFARSVRPAVRMAVRTIDRTRDWHAVNLQTAEMLRMVVRDAGVMIGHDERSKRLTGTARTAWIRATVAAQLFLSDASLLDRRVQELAKADIVVNDLITALGISLGDPPPPEGTSGTGGAVSSGGMPEGGSGESGVGALSGAALHGAALFIAQPYTPLPLTFGLFPAIPLAQL